MNGCIYRTLCGECDLYSEGGQYKAFCDLENCEYRKPSNADRIRNMTDEELAEMFLDHDEQMYRHCPSDALAECCQVELDIKWADCKDCWLDWLKLEVENENQT